VAEADALIALARERSLLLTAFHNRRWDGDFLTVRNLVESGRLGELMLCELHWDRFRPAIRPGWRDNPAQGASLLNDLGPHLIDQALQLFGKPDALAADLAAQRPASEVDDYHDIVLHYGPRRVRLTVSVLVPAPRPRFALHGTEGQLRQIRSRSAGEPVADRRADRRSRLRGGGSGAARPAHFRRRTAERIATEAGRYLDYYDGVAAGDPGRRARARRRRRRPGRSRDHRGCPAKL
jgi:scyllo-inositol 2-dehydrogenase (NADP+)